MKPSALYFSGFGNDQGTSLDDLLVSKSRSLVAITAVFFISAAIIISGAATTNRMTRLFALSVIFGLVSMLAYRMLENRYFLAHLIWQISLAVLVLAASFVLRQTEIIFLSALLPLIAAITLGFGSALIAELIVLGMIAWIQTGQMVAPLPQWTAQIIPIFGAFSGLLGWVTTNHLMKTASWALYNFRQAQDHLAEARQERLDLQQTQEDLVKANQELARLAGRLKILQRIAEESRQAKVEFVSNVSHELRTPLNMIIGFTEVITKTPQLYGSRLPPALMADITAIQRNSQHLLTMVNDILDLSQVEAGHMAISKEWNSITEIIQAAVELVQSLYDSKGLYLQLNLEGNLPQIFCDQTRIRQVIINLLSNAGRFTKQGGVRISCALEANSVVVRITDTGPGIPEEDRTRIFEPFQQLDNSTRRIYGGSGLGLAICKQFIELHEGKMWLESQPGNGTTFLFSLPLITFLEEETSQASQRVRRSIIPGDEYGYSLRTRPSKASVMPPLPRLIVLEKGQSLQRLLKRYMDVTEITVAHSLPEVIDQLNQSPAQALVVNAPPFEELSTGAVRIAPFGTPVISCWVPGEEEAAGHLGIFQYLLKPVTREKLLSVLQDLQSTRPEAEEIKQILVVDDESDELHLFARMLESAPKKYQVLQVSTGERAMEMMRSRKVDVLLLDLILPGMNGFQVLEEKRKDPAMKDIPVIIISSRDPQGEAITSSTILFSHSGGFSTRHLLDLIQAAVSIVLPEG
jgi:signal transduction histidine kinase/CheY-like chemotaxis protein